MERCVCNARAIVSDGGHEHICGRQHQLWQSMWHARGKQRKGTQDARKPNALVLVPLQLVEDGGDTQGNVGPGC